MLTVHCHCIMNMFQDIMDTMPVLVVFCFPRVGTVAYTNPKCIGVIYIVNFVAYPSHVHVHMITSKKLCGVGITM
jgi:hypothetical protein